MLQILTSIAIIGMENGGRRLHRELAIKSSLDKFVSAPHQQMLRICIVFKEECAQAGMQVQK